MHYPEWSINVYNNFSKQVGSDSTNNFYINQSFCSPSIIGDISINEDFMYWHYGDTNNTVLADTSGTYVFLYQDNLGCDYLTTYNVEIANVPSSTMVVYVCNEFFWNSTTYYSSQIIYDTIIGGASTGCDSILNINLTINNRATGTFNIAACNSYLHNGTIYTTSQIIQDTIAGGASTGCDSVYTLNLNIHQPTNGIVYDTIQQGDEVLINEEYRNTSGVYYDTLSNSNNCDSIIEYNLTVLSGMKDEYLNPIKVYPNPSNSIFKVDLSNQTKSNPSYVVTNNLGQIIKQGIESTSILEIDLTNYESGIYFLQLNGKKVIKLLKN